MGFSINHSRGANAQKHVSIGKGLLSLPEQAVAGPPASKGLSSILQIGWGGEKLVPEVLVNISLLFLEKYYPSKTARVRTLILKVSHELLYTSPHQGALGLNKWHEKHQPCNFRYAKAYYSWKWVKYYFLQVYYKREHIYPVLKCKSNPITASSSEHTCAQASTWAPLRHTTQYSLSS